MDFTALERAALEELCKVAEEREALARQLATASVTSRLNTGSGFFTHLAVDRSGAAFTSRWRVLGEVVATIEGFEWPLNLILFQNKAGYADLLEGVAVGGDDTVGIDFSAVRFTINPPY